MQTAMPFQLSSPSAAHRAADLLQRVHDIRVVRALSSSRRCRCESVIAVSWAIAFIEYCFAVPANRYGSAVLRRRRFKTMQEVITLLVFAGFSLTYLKEPIGSIIWSALR